mmetsp:Transcript_27172/g.63207  ORF Transcript_27172/g.63207 Transcript_27172/m.63207 type:complete len:200 (-) Transcript_27172:169-768(-)|eukprot:CAMPEP_0178448922 /NCGR_PEP_ID=MMETSP0689_2-20121128/42255_1 /TAXON_ID=160604 /ORGANISM="Amphidinium massartii, Strain CS-259" /LENGTH=199 /DNA_ID=CAMNT_0020074165 /DNA_START=39 /DNA_END=638 /DNA_ORIENTATION=+
MAKADEAESGATKKSGYTYWKRDIDDAHVLPDNKPKPLDESVKSEQEALPAKAPSGSRWNSAGTWEEKDISSAAREMFEQILCEETVILLGQPDGETKVQAFSASVTGDAQVLNIRGTARVGFEFKVNLKWSGTFEGQPVSGVLDVQDLDSMDLSDFEIKPKASDSAEASKKAAEALKKGARPALKAAAEELGKRMLQR